MPVQERDPKERVVITGLGGVGPTGKNVPEMWANIIDGKIGIGPINDLRGDLTKKVKVEGKGEPETVTREIPGIYYAGMVPDFDPPSYIPKKELKNISRASLYSTVAAMEALEDAGLMTVLDDSITLFGIDPENVGAIIGTGIGGAMWIARMQDTIRDRGVLKIMPSDMRQLLIDRIPSVPSMIGGLRGPVKGSFSACASGAGAIIDAYYRVKSGKAKAMVTGGAEGCLSEVGCGSFLAVKALALQNPDSDPTRLSIPFDEEAFGFVMGEGAGMVTIERLDNALARKAKIYAELLDFGETADAYDDVAPSGEGAFNAMLTALVDAGVDPGEVDYINAHGTSTPIGDPVEADVIARLFGSYNSRLLVSSTKGATGHALGAAAALETLFCVLAIRDNIVPPTAGLRNPICDDINFVPRQAIKRQIDMVLNNAFAFGGMNSTLLLRSYYGPGSRKELVTAR